MLKINQRQLAVVAALFSCTHSFALTISDDFTQGAINDSPGSSTGNGMNWMTIAPACLTAGTSANNSTTAPNTSSIYSNIPACNITSNSGIGTPEPVGSGALRLTNATPNQAGAIISQGIFPSNQGLQVTFTTYTYGGSGADGIGFFLQDALLPTTLPYVGANVSTGNANIGESGGSLGYSCSNYKSSNYNGLTGAYLGLGMDEFGNFTNGATFASNGNITSANDNTASGLGFLPNTISLRGAGNISWYYLSSTYPAYYPLSLSSSLQLQAVQNTCKYGHLWNYAGATSTTITSLASSGMTLTVTIPAAGGYQNGDSVTLGGTITAAVPSSKNIVGNPSVSSSNMTVAVPSVSNYSSGQTVTIGGTISAAPITKGINSFSNYSSSNPKSIRVNVLNSSSTYSAGDTVVISGVSGANSSIVNRSFVIASVSTNYFVIPGLSGNPGTLTGGIVSTVAPTINGAYVISNINTSSNTFQVTLASAASSISNTSGTVTGAPVTIPGTYTIANVNTTSGTFEVTLIGAPGSITNTSGTVINNSLPTGSGRMLSTTLLDYPSIPGSVVTLPGSTPLWTSARTRVNAVPVTYKLSITPAGLLSFLYSYNGGAYQSALTNFQITTSNGPLPANFRFGFLGSTGGSTNVHEITCFAAQPTESASSAGANTVQAGQVRTGTQVYLASYNPNTWSGSLVSDALINTNGVISVATAAEWDGNCVLTGGGCASMGTVNGVPINTIPVEAPASRTLLTWDGAAGIPLEWTNLTAAQKAILNASDAAGANRLGWLRGVRSQEQTVSPAGPLRARAGVLGDIIDSSPTWVGPPSKNYAATFTDALYGAGPETSYLTFKNSLATRLNVVYAGSNDGLLHGFRTGRNNVDGSFNATNNDGYEVIGFMPSLVLANANVVGLTRPTYGHNYFVDATPGFGELFYNNAWHTWLVGGVGPGGAEIYALDVTDPTGAVTASAAFTESHASNLVMGDWTAASLTSCVHATTNCGANLGNTYGTPLIRRLHNGQWALIFGNGLGSANGHAGVFIGLVSPTSGAVTYYWLDTGSGSSSNENGITNVASADLDGDFVTDYLYAGDLQGQVWRIDLTSNNPANWAVSTFGQPTATPLFVARDSSGNQQPITSSISVTATLTGGAQRVILGFGTGRAIPFTSSTATSYESGAQSVYGIWDWDMAAWNSASSRQYAVLPEITTAPYRTFTRTSELSNSVATQTATTRTAVTTVVCWIGSNACNANNTQYGWLFDLPGNGEQVIYNPVFSGGELLVNTTIPPQNSVGQCTLSLTTGWTMAFNIASGGGAPQNVFPDASGNLIVSSGYGIVGVKQNAVGTPYIVSVGSKQYIVNQTAGGSPTVTRLNPQGGVTVKRMSWEQLR